MFSAETADLDLEDLDATQLEEELEDVPDLQTVSDVQVPVKSEPGAVVASAAPAASTTGYTQASQQQQYQTQPQQQQYAFGSVPSAGGPSGQQGYGTGNGNGLGMNQDGVPTGVDRIKPSDMPDEGLVCYSHLSHHQPRFVRRRSWRAVESRRTQVAFCHANSNPKVVVKIATYPRTSHTLLRIPYLSLSIGRHYGKVYTDQAVPFDSATFSARHPHPQPRPHLTTSIPYPLDRIRSQLADNSRVFPIIIN